MSRSALAVLALVLPVAALAQAGSSAPPKLPAAEKKTAASAKSSTPSGSNAAASKTTKVASSGKKTVPAAAPVSSTSSRTQLHSAAVQVAAGIRAAEAALTPGELAIAQQVHRGVLPCELGASVTVDADERVPGYFTVSGKGFRYRMHPVETSTGAIRLEDKQAGAVWLQLANKSMLMNQKQGRRIADECANAEQVATATALKNNPPPALIDVSEPVKR